MRQLCLLLLLTLAFSAEDESCVEDPNSESCRERVDQDLASLSVDVPLVTTESTPSQVPPKTTGTHKKALQTAEQPLELLSLAKAFTGEQIAPLSAITLMSVRMPRNMAVVARSSPGVRPHKRLFVQLLLKASRGRLLVLDAVEGDILLDTETAVEISMMKGVADRLAIAYKDGSLRIFKVVATGEESVPSPKKKKDPANLILRVKLELEAEVPPYVPTPPSLDPDSSETVPTSTTPTEAPPTLTALSLQVVKGRLHWLLGGYDNGMVASFTREGFVKTETPTNSSVVGFTPGQSSFVVAINEQGFGMVRVSSRVSPVSMFCGLTANGTVIRSMAYDPLSPSVLYGVTQAGRLLVFNTKASRDLHVYCQPKHTVIVEDGSPLSIVATKGFLFVTSPSALYIYNVSNTRVREAPTFTLRRVFFGESAPLPTFSIPSELQPPLSLNILLRETNEEYVEVSQLWSGETLIFTSHLPLTEDGKGSTMFRLPILLGGIIAMGFFQMYKKRKATPNINDPMMRELREIGQRSRFDPKRDGKSNRRFGLTAGRKMPSRAPRDTERPPDMGDEADADQSDPEELLTRRKPARSQDEED